MWLVSENCIAFHSNHMTLGSITMKGRESYSTYHEDWGCEWAPTYRSRQSVRIDALQFKCSAHTPSSWRWWTLVDLIPRCLCFDYYVAKIFEYDFSLLGHKFEAFHRNDPCSRHRYKNNCVNMLTRQLMIFRIDKFDLCALSFPTLQTFQQFEWILQLIFKQIDVQARKSIDYFLLTN